MSGKNDKTKTTLPQAEVDMNDIFAQVDQHTPPPELFHRLHQIPIKHPRKPTFRLGWLAMLAPVSAMALFAFMWWSPNLRSLWTQAPEDIKLPPTLEQKGSYWQALYAHYRSGGKAIKTRELHNRTVLYPGDLLQFTYKLRTRGFVFIVGVTEDGTLYPLHPRKSQHAAPIERGKGLLPCQGSRCGAVRLDRYIGLERFFVLESGRPFTLQEVRRALTLDWSDASRDLHKLKKITGHWQCTTFLIEKRKRPAQKP